jgi:hypothetical protein
VGEDLAVGTELGHRRRRFRVLRRGRGAGIRWHRPRADQRAVEVGLAAGDFDVDGHVIDLDAALASRLRGQWLLHVHVLVRYQLGLDGLPAEGVLVMRYTPEGHVREVNTEPVSVRFR